ncbi:SGNH/GDSL hydrolase family protein [Microbacterium neimengense]
MTGVTVLFAGDSVTDCGRREDPSGLGDGYVRLLANDPALAGCRVINRGVSGDRARDLRARWRSDVAAQEPALVSILVGVNDTWRRFDADDPTSAERFEADYRAMLDATRARVVLVEPFLLPVRAEQHEWRADLEAKIEVVHRLAFEYRAVLVPADAALSALGDPAALAPDGVHPSPAGHTALARLWLAATTDLREELSSR